MTTSAPPHSAPRLIVSRDWPLVGAAIAALLSFIMLLLPWLTAGSRSENAFGAALQTAGPVMIIISAFVTIGLLFAALWVTSRGYLTAVLVSAAVLVAFYAVKAADTAELADFYNRLLGETLGVSFGTGIGVWLGLAFASVALLCVLLALACEWGSGESLVYPPMLRRPHRTGVNAPQESDPGHSPPPPGSGGP
ncbi:hypothetical protein [Streptomyces sp. NPDC047028]|uniref:hypothetical protein n=1 Tax=Streptomyces sp. NPDC047028 TaxID=3155793 RepID=UPI0033F1FE72